MVSTAWSMQMEERNNTYNIKIKNKKKNKKLLGPTHEYSFPIMYYSI
jgi:hypothetical protein